VKSQVSIRTLDIVPGSPGATVPVRPLSPAAMAAVDRLRPMSVRGLGRMFDGNREVFVFRVRRTADGIRQEGLSPRYTAITLLGMAHLDDRDTQAILGTVSRERVCSTLLQHAATSTNLGDVALSLWAGFECGSNQLEPVLRRLGELKPADEQHPTVEVAWTLSALSDYDDQSVRSLRDRVAQRLMSAYSTQSRLFPHMVDPARAGRSHVACFADLIYPIQALAKYAERSGHAQALDIASACAEHLCSTQGDVGQWWWHYDYRTGHVLERYPVYAIHQDAMGPMGLLALRSAGGADCSRHIERGLEWLLASPELRGGTLIDTSADLIWRKVARRESRKAVRYMQAGLARLHPALRVPAVDALFPPGVIDDEDRPYHLGWLLYAWRDMPATQPGQRKV
jgi:hypothetical protein